MATSPLLSAVLAAVFYRERLTPARVCGALLGLAGVALVVLGSGKALGAAGWGDAMVFLAVVVFVCGGLVIQRMSRSMAPLAMLWYMYLAGGLMLAAHAGTAPSTYRAESWSMAWWPWLVLMFSAVVASGISNILWNGGIARLGISRASLFLNWLPIFGLLFAALFLRGGRHARGRAGLRAWRHLAGIAARRQPGARRRRAGQGPALSAAQRGREQARGFDGEIGQDAVGAGALERQQRFHHDLVVVQPAIGGGGLDHRVLAADLVGEGRHAEGVLTRRSTSRYGMPGLTMTMSAPSCRSDATSRSASSRLAGSIW